MKLGKRLYIASLGRFLQADPIEGGTPNEYTYVVDPVNSNDFSGEWGWGNITSFVSNAWNQTVNAVSNAVRAVTTFVTENIIKPIIHVAQTTYRAVKHVVKQVARAAVQVVKAVVNYAYIAAQRIQQAVQVAAATASAIANRIAQDSIKTMRAVASATATFADLVLRENNKILSGIYATPFLRLIMPGGSSLAILMDCHESIISDKCYQTALEVMSFVATIATIVVGAPYLAAATSQPMARLANSPIFMRLAERFPSLATASSYIKVFNLNATDALFFRNATGIIDDVGAENALQGQALNFSKKSEFLKANPTGNYSTGNHFEITETNITSASNMTQQIDSVGGQGTFANQARGVFRNTLLQRADGSTAPGNSLPSHATTGTQVQYQEYYLNPVSDSQRLIKGSDNSWWYSPDHYVTFLQLK